MSTTGDALRHIHQLDIAAFTYAEKGHRSDLLSALDAAKRTVEALTALSVEPVAPPNPQMPKSRKSKKANCRSVTKEA